MINLTAASSSACKCVCVLVDNKTTRNLLHYLMRGWLEVRRLMESRTVACDMEPVVAGFISWRILRNREQVNSADVRRCVTQPQSGVVHWEPSGVVKSHKITEGSGTVCRWGSERTGLTDWRNKAPLHRSLKVGMKWQLNPVVPISAWHYG